MSERGMRSQLYENGLRFYPARNAALRALVRQTPPALVAQALGFSSGAAAAATAYQEYAERPVPVPRTSEGTQ